MTVRIVTDSTSDIAASIADKYRIEIVPLTIYFGNEALRDGVDITAAEFFKRLPGARPLPRTSAPAPGAFLEAYERLATEAETIICITISGKLSGTLNAANAARELFREPGRITVLDSLGATAAEANVVVAAARAAEKGMSLDEVLAIAVSVRARQELLVGLETLEFLQRGGRIGRAQAFLGGLLNVKPILTLGNGEVAPAERVRSRARMIERLYQFALSHPHPEAITLAHAAAPAECEELAGRIRAASPTAPIDITWIGPVIGVYTGPGALGVAVVPELKT